MGATEEIAVTNHVKTLVYPLDILTVEEAYQEFVDLIGRHESYPKIAANKCLKYLVYNIGKDDKLAKIVISLLNIFAKYQKQTTVFAHCLYDLLKDIESLSGLSQCVSHASRYCYIQRDKPSDIELMQIIPVQCNYIRNGAGFVNGIVAFKEKTCVPVSKLQQEMLKLIMKQTAQLIKNMVECQHRNLDLYKLKAGISDMSLSFLQIEDFVHMINMKKEDIRQMDKEISQFFSTSYEYQTKSRIAEQNVQQ